MVSLPLWSLFAPIAMAQVKWISSSATSQWNQLPAPAWVQTDEDNPAEVRVEPRKTFQSIDGFGGCFNELGWRALGALPAAEKDRVMQSLFGDEGCGFTMGRLPIGASDFALNWYSLDDTPGDLALKHFSIDRDRISLIPFVKAAMHVRPDLKCWGSAWSPPAWMKDNNNYSGGSIRWEPATLQAYANYLAKWAEAYRGEGINVFAVFTQNEPNVVNNYATCVWSGSHLRDFITDYLGPTLRDRKSNIELWLGTLNDEFVNGRAITVLNDPKANAFITGVSFQYGGKASIGPVSQLYPDKKLMQSETECASGDNSWVDAQRLYQLMKHYLDHGANSYFMWNMVLDQTGLSSWNWRQNAMITIDQTTRTAKLNGEYYVMRHFSQFVKPGAKRAMVTGIWGDQIAFVNPDRSIALVIGNSAANALPIRLSVGGRKGFDTLVVTLPAGSINTFIIPPL
jgi:glucosylceramidase